MTFRLSDILALCFFAWAGLSLLWTPDQAQGAFQLSHALVALCAFVVVSRLPDRAVDLAILPGVLLALLGHYVLLYVLPPDWYGAFGNKNFGAEFLLGAIPLAAVALWGTRFRHIAWLAAAAGVVLLFTVYGQANAKYVALLCLGISIAGYLVYRRFYLLAAIIVLLPLDALVLWGFNAWSFSSLRVRIELWTNTLALWLEKPLQGHGFGSFNHEYPRYAEYHLSLFPEMGTLLNQPAMFSGAAHSEPLQLLAELGLIGLFLACALVLVLIRERVRRGNLTATDYGCLATVILTLGAGLVGFPLQNAATIALAVMALGILARNETVLFSFGAGRLVRLAAVSPLIALSLWVGWLHFDSRRAYTQIRIQMEANDLPAAFIANLRAVEIFSWDWLPRYQLSLTLAALAIHDRKSTIEPGAADRVFEISSRASPFASITRYSRIAYLDAANRVDESKAEIEDLLSQLKAYAVLQPSTWLAEQWFAERTGDRERAIRAQVYATNPLVMKQAGHLYPKDYLDHLAELAKQTERQMKELPQ